MRGHGEPPTAGFLDGLKVVLSASAFLKLFLTYKAFYVCFNSNYGLKTCFYKSVLVRPSTFFPSSSTEKYSKADNFAMK